MTRRRHPLPPHALAAYLEGEVTPSEAVVIEAHVRDSGTARRELDQLDEIRRTLARLPDGPDEPPPAEMAALWRAIDAAPTPPRRLHGWRRGRTSAWLGLGAGACAALCAVLLLRPSPQPITVSTLSDPPASEFQHRAAATIPDDRWVHIEVLRVETDGTARPLPGRGIVRADDKLVFRYASGGPDPFGFLMVFAVDAAQDIHWYYPAYETAGSDPPSVAIRGGGVASLPDAIEHRLPAGPLVFYGVFTRAPLHVVDVERRVEATLARQGWNPDLPPRLPIDISGQHLVGALVVP